MNRLTIVLLAALSAPLAAQQLNCTTQVVGTGCGPTFTADWTPVGAAGNQTLSIHATGLDPNAVSVMAWGTQQLNVTLPFGGCPMFNDFIWGHIVNPTALGDWQWSRSWPATSPGQYFVQFGSLSNAGGALTITTSDSRSVQCL